MGLIEGLFTIAWDGALFSFDFFSLFFGACGRGEGLWVDEGNDDVCVGGSFLEGFELLASFYGD